MKALPRGAVERLAARHPSGRAKRILGAWGHVASMVVGQLAGTRSLRDLERLLERHSGVHAHLGLQAVRRSTLADANAGRPCALFEDIARQLSSKLDRRGIAGEAVRLIDATRIFAGRRCASWTASGALKLHIVYDPAGERPVPLPRPCRCSPGPPMCSTRAITASAGGRRLPRKAAASSPG